MTNSDQRGLKSVGVIPGLRPCKLVYLAECGTLCSNVGQLVIACGVQSGLFSDYSVCRCGHGTTCPKYPGNDPSKAPPGTQWGGKPGSSPGDGNGSYFNPNTGERYYPDLGHEPGIPPHWDYTSPNGVDYRIFPGNVAIPKS